MAHPWNVGGNLLPCSPVPLIMGIVNATPDSFFDGGKYNQLNDAFLHAQKLLDEGAQILDIGGESSRPGSTPVSAEEEMERVCPLIEKLSKLASQRHFYISVDTVKATVAKEAVGCGAHIINDISACTIDPNMMETVKHTNASVVLNHMRGNLGTMQQDFKPYQNVVAETRQELLAKAQKLLDLGVEKSKICLDPGIGFGKSAQNNIDLIKSIEDFTQDGYPILVGSSRKSYIGKIQGLTTSNRLIPTVVAGVMVALGGASVLRVHDVQEARESLAYLEALKNGSV